MKEKLKRSVTGILALSLLLGCLSGCGGNTATTMRLKKYQGTVGVEDAKDARLEAREGMQLYSGYEVGTADESRAWIDLDEYKAVKLEQLSTGEILKDGKHLTLKLHEGKLFFNVTKPLEEDETLNIQAATMVTGIRGTSGYVQVLPGGLSAVTVLDGQVEVVSVRSGEKESLSAGNSAYAEEGGGIRLAPVEQASIPGFVIRELQRDEALRQRVQEESGLPVEELLDSAEQRLEEERQEQREFRAQQNALLAEMPGQVSRPEGFVIPYIPEPVTSSSTAPPTASP